jgi:hypothetical protein
MTTNPALQEYYTYKTKKDGHKTWVLRKELCSSEEWFNIWELGKNQACSIQQTTALLRRVKETEKNVW